MATTKITDLTAYTDPVNTDVLPIVDVTSDVTKKVSIANVMKNASLGSNTAPGIAFDGDPNTGIYSPGADQVAVTTGGTQRLLIDSAGAVTIAGDLTVNGTTTNINTTNLVIEDKNIILGDVTTPTDVTADGGGITLKGTTDKTINWVDSTDAWTSSERFSYPLGSAAAPTLTFTGDANTGIYSPGADQVAISTNGTGRLFVDANGYVGVGASPTLPFDAQGRVVLGALTPRVDENYTVQIQTAGSTALKLQSGASSASYLVLGTTADALTTGFAVNNTDGALRFRVGNTERMRLDSSGRLGLGTSSPNANLELGPVSATQGPTLRLSAGTGGVAGIPEYPFGTLQFYSGDTSGDGAAVKASIAGVADTASSAPGGELTFSTYPVSTGSLTERMRIDSSGRVGIGTTTVDSLLHLAAGVGPALRLEATSNALVLDSAVGEIEFEANDASAQGTGIKAKIGAYSDVAAGNSVGLRFFAGAISESTGTERYRIAADGGHIFNGVGGTSAERARIDSSGRLLVGTSSSRAATYADPSVVQIEGLNYNAAGQSIILNSNDGNAPSLNFGKSRGTSLNSNTVVQVDDRLGVIDFAGADGTVLRPSARIEARVDGTPGANDMPGRLVFSTTLDGASSPSERVRITNKGHFKATNSVDYFGATSSYHELRSDVSNEPIAIISHTNNSQPFGLQIRYTATSPNGTSNHFLECIEQSTTRLNVRSNGGIANFSANNVNLSDRNAKKDIAPATGTWDCLKEWEIVNFRYKDQPDDSDLNMGVIAQQVAESCPEVITVFQEAKEATETEPAQEERLGVKDQQMMWMAIKALQEAQLRIETLEAEVAALKGA